MVKENILISLAVFSLMVVLASGVAVSGVVVFDADGDGIDDGLDNCVGVANPDQSDVDGDGIGDVCDACVNDASNDVDVDGFCADVDNCPNDPNADQTDYNSNGVGDACDDFDWDGVYDSADNCLEISNSGQEDADSDGLGDACDDSDSDGYYDDSDCDDDNADVYPDASEICSDRIDNDCDGGADCEDGTADCAGEVNYYKAVCDSSAAVIWDDFGFSSNVQDCAVADMDDILGKDLVCLDDSGVGTVRALGFDGLELWSNSDYYGYKIAAGDVNNDGDNEVAFGTWGSFGVLDNSGINLLFSEGTGQVMTDVEIADLDGDGISDVISSDNAVLTTIYARTGDGTELWTVWNSAAAIATGDIDGDGDIDVASIGNDGLYALDGLTGGEMWSRGYYGQAIEIGNVVEGDENEVVAGLDDGAYWVDVFDSGGMELWYYEVDSNVVDVQLGNLDDDAENEVVAITSGGTMYVFDNDGILLWTKSISANDDSRDGDYIAIADINGDGENEIAVGSSWVLYAYDKEGYQMWSYNFDIAINDVEVGDVNDDGLPEIIAAIDSDGVYGGVYVFANGREGVYYRGIDTGSGNDATSSTDVVVEVYDSGSASNIGIASYGDINPKTDFKSSLGKFYSITAEGGTIGGATIKVYYTDAELSASGLEESSLRLAYYNESSGSWEEYDGEGVGGVETSITDEGFEEYSGYIWANTTHFSVFGAFGAVPAVVSENSGGGSGGSGSGGKAYCGDKMCTKYIGEDCNSCAQDCGICEIVSSDALGGNSGSSGNSGTGGTGLGDAAGITGAAIGDGDGSNKAAYWVIGVAAGGGLIYLLIYLAKFFF